MVFKDREEAGKELAKKIIRDGITGRADKGVVLGIPRGGVVLARQVAEALGWRLSVVVTKKVEVPSQPELAAGAMGPKGKVTWNEELVRRLGLSEEDLSEQIQDSKIKVKEYLKKFGAGGLRLNGGIVVVDDGMATGATMKAALTWLRCECKRQKAKCKIIVAVPVVANDKVKVIRQLVDELVVLAVRDDFFAVGQFYEHFPQVSQNQVVKLLNESNRDKNKKGEAAEG